MCGIALCFHPISHNDKCCNTKEFDKMLRGRGPDHIDQVTIKGTSWECHLKASVLHLRGPRIVTQPISDTNGNILAWNGQVFGGEINVALYESDTAKVLYELGQSTDVVATISQVQGPFAFVYYRADTRTVYYGHDRMGRRSLVSTLNDNDNDGGGMIIASSLPARYSSSCIEVSCTGVYSLSLDSTSTSIRPTLHYYKKQVLRPLKGSEISAAACNWGNIALGEYFTPSASVLSAAKGLLRVLFDSVKRRVENIPPSTKKVGLLFSGGLDSVVLAALTHVALRESDDEIDLLNVCFDSASSYNSPDRKAASASVNELRELFPNRKFNFVKINVPYEDVRENAGGIQKLLAPCDSQMDFNIGAAFWFCSRGKGVLGKTTTAKTCDNPSLLFNNTKKAKKRVCASVSCKRKSEEGCVYRSCKSCCEKLHLHLPIVLTAGMNNSSTSEFKKASGIIKKLIGECVVDGNEKEVYKVSNRCDVHGEQPEEEKEKVRSEEEEGEECYVSQTRVLLVGIGADELLAGYSRHRTMYEASGAEALRQELKMDMERIWKRNLGRDDRCISDHGRESRFPFLDINVITYLQSLPVETLADFTAPRGIGEKYLLRLVGRALGLRNCTVLAKRAIQFGTRIAKYSNVEAGDSNRKAKGTDKMLVVPSLQ